MEFRRLVQERRSARLDVVTPQLPRVAAREVEQLRSRRGDAQDVVDSRGSRSGERAVGEPQLVRLMGSALRSGDECDQAAVDGSEVSRLVIEWNFRALQIDERQGRLCRGAGSREKKENDER